MSIELTALLEDIRSNPEDDLPRLALADWCQEQDDAAVRARGEFIHLRCRAAALPLADPHRRQLEWLALALAETHAERWLEGLAPYLAGWSFDRGMTLVQVSAESLERHSLDTLARQPGWQWVIGLRGVALGRAAGEVVVSPLLERLTSLDLGDNTLDGRAVAGLGTSRYVRHLTVLRLGYCSVGDAGAEALAGSPHLDRLTTLVLHNNGLTAAGAGRLAAATTFGRLVALDLSRNSLGDAGARAVARGTWQQLRRLALSGCDLTSRCEPALTSARAFALLETLDLTHNRFNDVATAALRERFGAMLLV